MLFRSIAEQGFELGLLGAQFGELALDLDAFEAGQLAQADLEDVLGLAVTQLEAGDQRRFGLVRLADDADHLVDVEEDDVPAFEDVDAIVGLGQTEFAASAHRGQAELAPLADQVGQRLLARPPVEADGDTSLGDLIARETAPGPDEVVLDAEELCYAFSRQVDDSVIKQFQRALTQALASSEYQGLRLKYLPAP